MSYVMKDNTGSLFPNDRKKTDKHPDWTGKALIGGVEHYLDAWIKQGNRGEFFSLSIKPVGDAKSASPAPAPAPSKSFAVAPQKAAAPASSFDAMDDDIPF